MKFNWTKSSTHGKLKRSVSIINVKFKYSDCKSEESSFGPMSPSKIERKNKTPHKNKAIENKIEKRLIRCYSPNSNLFKKFVESKLEHNTEFNVFEFGYDKKSESYDEYTQFVSPKGYTTPLDDIFRKNNMNKNNDELFNMYLSMYLDKIKNEFDNGDFTIVKFNSHFKAVNGSLIYTPKITIKIT